MAEAEDHQNSAPNRQGHPQGWRQRWSATSLPNRLMIIATGAIAAATIVNLGVAVGQWKILGRQLDEMVGTSNYAERQAVLAIGQLATANRNASYAQQQAKAAQNSANAIQQQTETAARPWLKLSEIALTGEITIDKDGAAHTTVHVVAENIGKTPAREVSLMAELAEPYNEHKELERLCTMSFVVPQGTGKYGQVLFPTDTLGKNENQSIGVKLTPMTLIERKQAESGTGYSESFRVDKNGPPPSQKEMIYPVPSSVIGCVQYKSFTSDTPYYTGFVYNIRV